MNSSSKRKPTDQTYKKPAIYLLIATILTGLFSAWGDNLWRNFAQWSQLLHLILGITLGIPLCVYLWSHFVKTLGARKPLLLATGLLTLAPIFWLLGSGIYLVILGETETTRWIGASHQYVSWLLIAATLLHLALYLPTAHKKGSTFSTRPAIISFTVIIIGVGMLSAGQQLLGLTTHMDLSLRQVPDDYQLIYGSNPFAPSQNTTPGQLLVAEHAIADSAECASCHQDIYDQWYSSIHRQAASDPTYVANINLLEKNMGIAAARYCEGCHAPVALMTGTLTEGGMHGGNPDSPAHHEGVGCTSCHRITGIEHTRGTASYYFEPASTNFMPTDNSLSRLLTYTTLRADAKAHRQEMADPTLYTAELCATCHEQFMDESMNNWGFVTMQHLYSDWLESPYSGQSEHQFANQQALRCQTCHMPLVAAKDPSADQNGMVRSHRFPGANTAIPWINGDQEQFQVVQDFLRSNRVSIKIEPVPRDDAPENQGTLSTELLPGHAEQRPYFLYLNETAEMRVSVSNRGVGHSFPAGTTDLNQVWIQLSVRDAENRLIYASGEIQDNGFVDPEAYFYKSIPVDRNGNEVWRHDLFNMVGDTYSNLIQAGETDIKNYRFNIPSWAKGPIMVDVRLNYRKFNQRYKNWALPDAGDLPVTEMAQDQLQVPLYLRAPVAHIN